MAPMSESEVLKQKQHLNTTKTIEQDLINIGVENGMNVIVHSSLSALGWVCGGQVAVIEALMNVVTENGLIVMPTQSAALSDPKNWMNPPVPEAWWQTIRETMPAYDPETTPTRAVGSIPELFRTFPNVIRSDHPTLSFAAWGKEKEQVIYPHPLNDGLGIQSPLGRMIDMNFYVLFIGTDHDSNTSFHLAEHSDPNIKEQVQYAPIFENGKRVWKKYKEIEYDADKFMEIGKRYEEVGQVKRGKIGLADAKLFPQKEAVNFAEKWLVNSRK
jgi:aminoglycoside 3-N-acetyltransferase